MIEEIRTTGNPLLLTVNGKAEIVVQDAEAYQKLLEEIERLKVLATEQKEFPDNQSPKLLDLYGTAADIEFALDDKGINNVIDNDITDVSND